MFGITAFNRALLACRDLGVAEAGPKLFAAVDDFAGEMPQHDDITLLLLELPSLAPSETTLSCAFPRGERLTSRVAEWLQNIFEQAAIDPMCSMELTLVAEEMVANIDKYAGLSAGAEILLPIHKYR